jgi:homoserine kinase type II
MLDTSAMLLRLEVDWGIRASDVSPLSGGMNSQTWLVTSGEDRWVAKAVPGSSQPGFAAGLAVAALVEAAGVPAGAPVPTRDGRLAVPLGGRTLGLLTFVPGEELSGGDAHEQHLIGSTLGRVHRALAAAEVPGADRFHWIDLDAGHLRVREWVRPAIAAVLAEWERADPAVFTQGLLHSDPAPEAFRFDPATGVCGLIDWDRALLGPLLYDVASAVMYVGGPVRARPLLAAYIAEGALSGSEVDRGLESALRMRWAVQADYFAWRIATDDQTGISSPAENEKGLEDARRALLAAST